MPNPSSKPPRLAQWILKQTLPADDSDYLLGDFACMHSRHADRHGMAWAHRWYWRQVFRTLPGFIVYTLTLRTAFARNQAAVMMRAIARNRRHAVVNVMGLGIGLTAFLLLFLWIEDETRFDAHFSRSRRIYRLISQFTQDGQRIRTPRVSTDLLNQLPGECALAAPLMQRQGYSQITVEDRTFSGFNVGFTTPAFLELFDLSSLKPAFFRSESVILSRGMAQTLLGDENPVGRVIRIDGKPLTVTGVMKNWPGPSHLSLDCLVNSAIQGLPPRRPIMPAYVQLKENALPDSLASAFTRQAREGFPQGDVSIELQELTDIHLYSEGFRGEYAQIASPNDVDMARLMALFILIIAGINFINLTTARSLTREKEVAVRKISGGLRSQILTQFMGESVALILPALGLALIAVTSLLPAFNQFTGKHLSLNALFAPPMIQNLAAVTVFFSVLAAWLSSVALSGFKPLEMLRPGGRRPPRSWIIRRLLVMIQFALSVFFIASALIIHHQIQFMSKTDLGYDAQHVFVVGSISDFIKDKEDIADRLRAHPAIVDVTRGFRPIYHQPGACHEVRLENGIPLAPGVFQQFTIDAHYLNVFRLKLLEGRHFSQDARDKNHFIINEKASQALNLAHPVGHRLTVDGQSGRIIGVVRDFHHASLHHPIQPLILKNRAEHSLALNVRVHPDREQEAADFVQAMFEKRAPGLSYDHIWIQDTLNAFYTRERRMARLIRWSALWAAGMAGLGLFGLAAHMAGQRIKEIGIRKVLGARKINISLLLIKEYLTLILWSNTLAWPATWFFTQTWLRQFAYHASPTLQWYPVAGALALLIAGVTVGHKAHKSASIPPINALRYE